MSREYCLCMLQETNPLYYTGNHLFVFADYVYFCSFGNNILPCLGKPPFNTLTLHGLQVNTLFSNIRYISMSA